MTSSVKAKFANQTVKLTNIYIKKIASHARCSQYVYLMLLFKNWKTRHMDFLVL